MKILKMLALVAGVFAAAGAMAQSATVQGAKQDAREIKTEAREVKENMKADARVAKENIKEAGREVKAKTKASARKAKAKAKAVGREIRADAHDAKEQFASAHVPGGMVRLGGLIEREDNGRPCRVLTRQNTGLGGTAGA